MNLEYLSLTFKMGTHDHEVWQALLSEWPFESFHDETDHIIGYVQDHDITEDMMEFITSHMGQHFDDYELAKVPDENWNLVWESSFNPVAVDDYCYIRADFHDQQEKEFKHIITLSPKMAFGTGHHATTFMMLQAISEIDLKDKTVLDFGCGTGILGIVAAKEGASKIVGVDIQPEAIENSNEHADKNGVSSLCEFHIGELDKTGEEKFDVILANINRNIIVENLGLLYERLNIKGHLLLSGIMFDDAEMMEEELKKYKMEITSSDEKDQWLQITAVKTKEVTV